MRFAMLALLKGLRRTYLARFVPLKVAFIWVEGEPGFVPKGPKVPIPSALPNGWIDKFWKLHFRRVRKSVETFDLVAEVFWLFYRLRIAPNPTVRSRLALLRRRRIVVIWMNCDHCDWSFALWGRGIHENSELPLFMFMFMFTQWQQQAGSLCELRFTSVIHFTFTSEKPPSLHAKHSTNSSSKDQCRPPTLHKINNGRNHRTSRQASQDRRLEWSKRRIFTKAIADDRR